MSDSQSQCSVARKAKKGGLSCTLCLRPWTSPNPDKKKGSPESLQRLVPAASICKQCGGACRKIGKTQTAVSKSLETQQDHEDWLRGPVAAYEALQEGKEFAMPADLRPEPSSSHHMTAQQLQQHQHVGTASMGNYWPEDLCIKHGKEYEKEDLTPGLDMFGRPCLGLVRCPTLDALPLPIGVVSLTASVADIAQKVIIQK